MKKVLGLSAMIILALIMTVFIAGCADPVSGTTNTGGGTSGNSSIPQILTSQIISDTSVAITWSAVNGADNYRVYVSSNNDPQNANSLGTTTSTSATITGLYLGTYYYAWVTAITSNGESDFSTAKMIYTGNNIELLPGRYVQAAFDAWAEGAFADMTLNQNGSVYNNKTNRTGSWYQLGNTIFIYLGSTEFECEVTSSTRFKLQGSGSTVYNMIRK